MLQCAIPSGITAPVHVCDRCLVVLMTRLGRRSMQESQLGRASLRRRIELKRDYRACVRSPRVVLRHDDACSGMTEHAAKSFGVQRVVTLRDSPAAAPTFILSELETDLSSFNPHSLPQLGVNCTPCTQHLHAVYPLPQTASSCGAEGRIRQTSHFMSHYHHE